MTVRRAVVGFASLLALGCIAASPPRPSGPEPVVVYFPAGDCGGVLELELFDRARSAWIAHPEHPRLAPGACALELRERLLDELRVRCVDPSGRRGPSAWVVGAELAAAAPGCAAAPSH